MTLQQLKYAVTIADCGSINEAAKRLFISQPSLSGSVKELEDEIGFEIYMQKGKGPTVPQLRCRSFSCCRAFSAALTRCEKQILSVLNCRNRTDIIKAANKTGACA